MFGVLWRITPTAYRELFRIFSNFLLLSTEIHIHNIAVMNNFIISVHCITLVKNGRIC